MEIEVVRKVNEVRMGGNLLHIEIKLNNSTGGLVSKCGYFWGLKELLPFELEELPKGTTKIPEEWKSEYPNISQLVTISDVNINGNNVKFVAPKDEAKSSPEGIAVMWYTNNKLWKAGLSNWNMINSSQSSFLNDFYTMISCSF